MTLYLVFDVYLPEREYKEIQNGGDQSYNAHQAIVIVHLLDVVEHYSCFQIVPFTFYRTV